MSITESAKNEWLAVFSSTVPCSNSFLQVFEEQLFELAKLHLGINLRTESYALLPSDSDFDIEFNHLNIGYFDAYLVGPDAEGYPVTVAWRCETHPDERIDPRSDLSDDCQLRAFWAELPLEEMRSKLKSAIPLWATQVEFNFVTEWNTFVWPDIKLILCNTVIFTDEQIEIIRQSFDKVITLWNNQSVEKGKVHYYSGFQHLSEQCLETHIDFGSAQKESFLRLLGALDRLKIIDKVVIQGA